ncbi:hypothetical protein BX257_3081 [Streptomyces sp. 3212.3]|nr:hypothetical protein BX257_3081 [Streptomyces sp. 3212.3]
MIGEAMVSGAGTWLPGETEILPTMFTGASTGTPGVRLRGREVTCAAPAAPAQPTWLYIAPAAGQPVGSGTGSGWVRPRT